MRPRIALTLAGLMLLAGCSAASAAGDDKAKPPAASSSTKCPQVLSAGLAALQPRNSTRCIPPAAPAGRSVEEQVRDYLAHGVCWVEIVLLHHDDWLPAGAIVEATDKPTSACPEESVRISEVEPGEATPQAGEVKYGYTIIIYPH